MVLETRPPATAGEAGPLPAVLDIEASGFGRASWPVEVGYVLADGRSHCTLVRPPPHWTHWDPAAEGLHGITRQQALDHGREPREVARRLNEHLAGQTVYCDGWAHDYAWLAALFDEAGLLPRFRLEHLRALLDERQAENLHRVRGQVRDELHLDRHRASADARVLQLAIGRLRALARPGARADRPA